MTIPTSVNPAYRIPSTPKEIAASKLIAKSVIKSQDNGVTIVAAFEKSTEYVFYITFTAKTPRTPKRLWKVLSARSARGFLGRQMQIEEVAKEIAKGANVTTRFPAGKKRFEETLEHVNNPMKYITATPAERLPQGATVDMLEKKLHSKMR